MRNAAHRYLILPNPMNSLPIVEADLAPTRLTSREPIFSEIRQHLKGDKHILEDSDFVDSVLKMDDEAVARQDALFGG